MTLEMLVVSMWVGGIAYLLSTDPFAVFRRGGRADATGSVLPSRRSAAIVVGAGVAFAALKAGAVVVVLAVLMARRSVSRRRERQRLSAFRQHLPDVADLISIGLSAGLTMRQTITAVAEVVANPVTEALGEAVEMMEQGHTLVGALHAIAEEYPDEIGGLLGVVVVAAHSGGSAAGVLSRFSDHEREVQRRASQESLRRLPVQLLPPIIVCVLPAFLLVTVVPIAIAVLTSLELPRV